MIASIHGGGGAFTPVSLLNKIINAALKGMEMKYTTIMYIILFVSESIVIEYIPHAVVKLSFKC